MNEKEFCKKEESTSEKAHQYTINSKDEIFKKVFEEMAQTAPSKTFASGAVFDIARQQREIFEAIVRSGNVSILLKWFIDAYHLFCENSAIVNLPLDMAGKDNDDARIEEMNADIFALPDGSRTALCFMPIQSDVLDARIIGIILSDTGDGYYYCMLKKDEAALSDVFRNKALQGIEKVGEIKGRGFELMNSFLDCIKNDFFEATLPKPDPNIVDMNPNCTSLLYNEDMGIRLFDESAQKDVLIKKSKILVGKDSTCDLNLTEHLVSEIHAEFTLNNACWLLRDCGSTNGTWLNGMKLDPNKKYVLHPDDKISFAKIKDYVFYKTVEDKPHKYSEDELLKILEEAIVRSSNAPDDTNPLKVMALTLAEVPIYFPTDYDFNEMFGNIDPFQLKKGDTINTVKDIKMKIMTCNTTIGEEMVPMFTSAEQAHKGPAVNITRLYPQDYLPIVISMNKSVILNPFDDNAMSLKSGFFKDIVLPLVQEKLKNGNEIKDENSDGIKVGTVLDNKYELLKEIGRGGLSTVYLANDTRINKMWAVKVVKTETSNKVNPIHDSIIQEAEMMKSFDHPAIPRVIDIINKTKYLAVVMDYVEGATLEDILREYGAQSAERVIEWAKQLCDVLGYLHSQNPPIIYRDLKPANVILQPNGTIKLIDFGIMREYDNTKDRDTCWLGTRGYAAPEQFGGRGQTDQRADIFGLGMTLHHLITGIDPKSWDYEYYSIRKWDPNLPVGLEYIIDKCIQLDPANRYQSCTELLKDLNDVRNLPPKKSFLRSLFGKKDKKSVESQQQWNPTIVRLYNGMDANGREKIFYGGISEAQSILLSLANSVFHSTADDKLELCLQIYVQCWIRSRGGFGMQFSTQTYIKQMLVRQFSRVPAQDVVACIERSLEIIYQHEPQIKENALSAELFMANVKEKDRQNVGIQDLYLCDEEYGIKPNKPIFVNGFGSDKEYLSHLYTQDNVKLAFERVGSSEVDGICGPVDLYKLLLPDGSVYMNIFLCNYGTRNTTDVPRGVVYR